LDKKSPGFKLRQHQTFLNIVRNYPSHAKHLLLHHITVKCALLLCMIALNNGLDNPNVIQAMMNYPRKDKKVGNQIFYDIFY